MRESLTTCGELFGATLFAIGMWNVNPALGLMTAGASLATFSWLASR